MHCKCGTTTRKLQEVSERIRTAIRALEIRSMVDTNALGVFCCALDWGQMSLTRGTTLHANPGVVFLHQDQEKFFRYQLGVVENVMDYMGPKIV